MTDLDKMAREMLAAECQRIGANSAMALEQAALAAIRTALLTAPPGRKQVPVVPTCEMLAAGERGHWQKQSDMLHPTPTEFPDACGGPMGYAYAAMLDAAPEVKP